MNKSNKIGRKPKSKLTIALDCGSLSTEEKKKGGIATITYNLIKNLANLDKQNYYLLYSFGPIPKELVARFNGRAKNKILWPSFGFRNLRLPLSFRIDRPDVFLALSQSVPKNAPPTLGFVYDIAFLKYPNYYANASQLKDYTEQLIQKSSHILTTSYFTKDDLIRVYDIGKNNVSVVYPGVSRHFSILGSKYAELYPYFLYVGQLKKTKNITQLIKAFAEFLKYTQKKYFLVLVGSDSEFDQDISEEIDKHHLHDHIIKKGYLSKEELPKFYRGALAFVSLAKYEGFGLPIIEAMACGCPVIVANNSSMPEIVGNSGLIVNHKNIKEITAAFIKLAENESLRKKLRRKALQRVKLFSWQKFTKEILKSVYKYCV